MCVLQVPWFVDLAVSGCRTATITPDGHVTLCTTSSSTTTTSSTSGKSHPHQQHKQQAAQQAGGKGSSRAQQQEQTIGSETALSMSLATTVAKLAKDSGNSTADTSSRSSSRGIAQVLLQRQLPQLLACPAPIEPGSLSSHWAAALVAAVCELHSGGNEQAVGVPHICLQHMQAALGGRTYGSTGDSTTGSTAAAGEEQTQQDASSTGRSIRDHARLCLGDAVCFALLAELTSKLIKQQQQRPSMQECQQQQQQQLSATGLDASVLPQLVDCAIVGLNSTGGCGAAWVLAPVLLPVLTAIHQPAAAQCAALRVEC